MEYILVCCRKKHCYRACECDTPARGTHDRGRHRDMMRVGWYIGVVSQTVNEELTIICPSWYLIFVHMMKEGKIRERRECHMTPTMRDTRCALYTCRKSNKTKNRFWVEFWTGRYQCCRFRGRLAAAPTGVCAHHPIAFPV